MIHDFLSFFGYDEHHTTSGTKSICIITSPSVSLGGFVLCICLLVISVLEVFIAAAFTLY